MVVITPAFQAEATLGSALASVAAQTRLPDEVIVADDGSTDGTVELARGWYRHLPVQVVTTEANSGPSAARRRAIEASTGDVVALLDADDVWFPDHLESMLGTYAATRRRLGVGRHPGLDSRPRRQRPPAERRRAAAGRPTSNSRGC